MGNEADDDGEIILMDEKTFYNTPLGKLFLNFELFHTHATSAIIATFTVEDSNNP